MMHTYITQHWHTMIYHCMISIAMQIIRDQLHHLRAFWRWVQTLCCYAVHTFNIMIITKPCSLWCNWSCINLHGNRNHAVIHHNMSILCYVCTHLMSFSGKCISLAFCVFTGMLLPREQGSLDTSLLPPSCLLDGWMSVYYLVNTSKFFIPCAPTQSLLLLVTRMTRVR